MGRKGFTLIELMIAVAIIAILSALVIPAAADCIRGAIEARTKSNLNAVRTAIKAYYMDFGTYPTDHLGDLIDKGYLKGPQLPSIWEPPYHAEGNGVCVGPPTQDTLDACTDAYVYDNNPLSPTFGALILSCIHKDLRGNPWSTY